MRGFMFALFRVRMMIVVVIGFLAVFCERVKDSFRFLCEFPVFSVSQLRYFSAHICCVY